LATDDGDAHAAADAALDRLRGPTTPADRLQVLRELVYYWHGPIGPDDGLPQEVLRELRIPEALRWWYGWAGRRTNILSGQNYLLDPDRLKLDPGGDVLVFYGENQWVYEWATLPEGDDPPVFGRYRSDDPWEPEEITLSEHLILACLMEGLMHAPYGASAAWLESERLAEIARTIPPIAINPWRWLGPARFYARGGAFMMSMPNGAANGADGFSVWLGAKTRQPLQFLKPLLDESWEYAKL
jgi:hypothetical protein